jgi:hypothetical protein
MSCRRSDRLGEEPSLTITLELPPDLEARLVAEAKAKGVPVDEVIKAYLYHAPHARSTGRISAAELDRCFDEAADVIPEGTAPLSEEAVSRESIYTREDDWNR